MLKFKLCCPECGCKIVLAVAADKRPHGGNPCVPKKICRKIDRLLGKMIDETVAKKCGVSHSFVNIRRRRLGIAPAHGRRSFKKFWPKIDPLLKTMGDSKIARKLGIFPSSVANRRASLQFQKKA